MYRPNVLEGAAALWILLAAATLTPSSLLAQAASKAAPFPRGAPAGMAHIGRAELLAHTMELASDSYEGRLTGSRGQQKAALYIRSHFEALGLEPLGDPVADGGRSFFQSYPLIRTMLDGATTLIEVGAQTEGGPEPLKLTEGFAAIVRAQAGEHLAEGELFFAGLGRTGGEAADIPEGTDLTGKIPLVLLPVPALKGADVMRKFGSALGPLGSANRLVTRLLRMGAATVLIGILEDDEGIVLDVLNSIAVAPGKDMMAPGDALQRLTGPNQMSMFAASMGGPEPRLYLSPKATISLLEALKVNPAAARRLLTAKGSKAPASKPIPARINLSIRVEDTVAVNVVARRKGSDQELAEQCLVYSAHMDHVGMRMDGEVFNGADDNASGTAGLLEIAKAFAKEDAPRRSVVFLSVSGEELGLWGSAWYADHPTVPLQSIIANINIDMIGRSGIKDGTSKDATDDDGVLITPSFKHSMFSTIVRDGAKFAHTMRMTLESGDTYYARSDHYNFAKKGIPAVFFCTGEHPDYHQVSDKPQKLDPVKMERVARLAYWTGFAVADGKEQPAVLGKSKDWKGTGSVGPDKEGAPQRR